MISNTDFKAIAELDLDPIKVKLMHKESGEGWTLDYANQVEFEYRRYLYLMKMFPNEQAAPSFDVDIFWHYHILDTMKYAVDCEEVFGYFLHHFPYLGLRGEEDEAEHVRVGSNMQKLYEDTFGEPYLRSTQQSSISTAATQDALSMSAWSVRVPADGTALSADGGKTAWSVRVPTDTAALSADGGKTAWSVRVPANGAALSADGGKTAWSVRVPAGGAVRSADAGKTAWSVRVPADGAVHSADAGKTAWSVRVTADSPVDPAYRGTLDRFYSERPTLAAA